MFCVLWPVGGGGSGFVPCPARRPWQPKTSQPPKNIRGIMIACVFRSHAVIRFPVCAGGGSASRRSILATPPPAPTNKQQNDSRKNPSIPPRGSRKQTQAYDACGARFVPCFVGGMDGVVCRKHQKCTRFLPSFEDLLSLFLLASSNSKVPKKDAFMGKRQHQSKGQDHTGHHGNQQHHRNNKLRSNPLPLLMLRRSNYRCITYYQTPFQISMPLSPLSPLLPLNTSSREAAAFSGNCTLVCWSCSCCCAATSGVAL